MVVNTKAQSAVKSSWPNAIRQLIAHPSAFTVQLLILLSYGLLALAYTWPLAANFGQTIPGQEVDTWQTYWHLEWLRDAFLNFKNPYFTTRLFFPEGTTLLFETMSPTNGVLALPVQLLFGTFVAYNSLVILTFALSGYATWLLVRYLTGNSPAAYLAGFIFAFSPYRMAQLLNHLHLISTQWLIFYIYFLWRALDTEERFPVENPGASAFLRARWRPLLAAAAFMVLNIFNDWYYVFFLLIFTAVLLLWRLLTDRKKWRQALAGVVVAAGGGLLVGLPLIIAMLIRARTAPALPFPKELSISFSADLLSYVTPSVLSPWWGWSGQNDWIPAYLRGNPTEKVVFMGYVTLFLAVASLGRFWIWDVRFWIRKLTGKNRLGSAGQPPTKFNWRKAKIVWFWFLVLVVFVVLSLGPKLQVGGPVEPGGPNTSINMPFAIINKTPLAGFVRIPSRFAVIATLAAAVLAGIGFDRLVRTPFWRLPKQAERVEQKEGKRTKLLFPLSSFLLLLSLSGVEFWTAPYKLANNTVPAVYQEIANDPSVGAIIELPLQKNAWDFPRRMYFQTVHEKNIIQGYTSREEANPLPPQNMPGLRQVLYNDIQGDITYDDSSKAARTFFDFYKFGYVVIDNSQAGPKTLQNTPQMLNRLFGPVQEQKWPADNYTSYRIPLQPSEQSLTEPLMIPGSNWFETEKNQTGEYRWMGEEGRLLTLVPRNSEQQIYQLRVEGLAFAKTRQLVLRDDRGQDVGHLTIGTEPGVYKSEPFRLPQGENWLNLISVDGSNSPMEFDPKSRDKRQLSVLAYKLQLLIER